MKEAREYAEVGHGLPAVIDAEGEEIELLRHVLQN